MQNSYPDERDAVYLGAMASDEHKVLRYSASWLTPGQTVAYWTPGVFATDGSPNFILVIITAVNELDDGAAVVTYIPTAGPSRPTSAYLDANSFISDGQQPIAYFRRAPGDTPEVPQPAGGQAEMPDLAAYCDQLPDAAGEIAGDF